MSQVAGTLTANTGGLTRPAENANELDFCIPTEVAFTTKLHNTRSNNAGKLFEERSPCLDANSPAPALLTSMAVRRLTPVECERLQGFPDNYTNIPWRTYQEAQRKGVSYESLLAELGMTLRGPSIETCPHGPRYKALGNSWAVPVARWIGQRIQSELRAAERRSV
jgi:DNA (cytosine-5)-methyltransferase 1